MAETFARFLNSWTSSTAAPPPPSPTALSSLSRLLAPTDRLVAQLDDVLEAPPVSSDGARPLLQRTRTGRRGVALVVHAEEGAASGDDERGLGAVIVYGEGAGPLGPLVVERLFVVDEGFRVELEQTDTSKFLVILSPSSTSGSPSSASAEPGTLSFLTDASHNLSLFTTAFAGSLGAAYSSRRRSSSRPPLSSLDWSSPSPHSLAPTALPGSFDGPPTSPIHERGEADATSLYSKETHAAMERWLVQRMREREDEFLKKERIRVWCGTFNVNDKQPKSAADIQSWVDSSDGAELLVFGFQELDLTAEALLRYTPYREEVWRKAIEASLLSNDGAPKYEKLHSRQLVGVLLLVYVRSDVKEHVSDVSSASLATGLMGLVANKGGVGVRLRYKDTPLTFVNSHLAAFTENVAQRNAQVRGTAATLLFPHSSPSSASVASLGDAGEGRKERDPWTPNLRPEAVRPLGAGADGYSVWDCETLVWMGDLNYRIDLPRKEVERMIETKEWDFLQRFDQLRIQRQHQLAFADFEEPKIEHPPSFKFDVGTSTYDTSEKQRVPSWTDRILFTSIHDGSVRCDEYTSHMDVVLSDHKPVSALLNVPVYTVIPDKRTEVQQQVIAELDSFDNDAVPEVKLAPGPSVEFGEIRYEEPVTKEVEVVNVGQVIAPWTFVCKPGTSSLTPPWLHLSPTSGLVLPNERSKIKLTILVTASSAGGLTFPPPSSSSTDIGLSDLLILSVEKRDLFLSVSAREWVPTVFGASLECLVRLHEPVRSLPLERRERIAAAAAGEAPKEGEEIGRVSVPQVLHRLVDFLAEHALGVRDLFCAAGESELVKAVRECLDTGDDFPLDRLLPSSTSSESLASPDSSSSDKEHLKGAVSAIDQLEADIGSIALSSPGLDAPSDESSRPRSLSAASSAAPSPPAPLEEEDDGRYAGLHSVADCVLRLLESLEEPVVTYELYARAVRAERTEEAYAVVQALPEVHANTLLYIIAFLRILLQQTTDSAERAARMDRLALVFSSVLLRPPPSSSVMHQYDKLDPATVPRRKKAFVLFLLREEADGAAA
ncbi:hypothetical protein JCM8097_006227 [Rhodosporidiobolus ruineniae]